MTFIKFLPAVFAAAALSACSTVSDVASSTADAVGSAGSAVVSGAKTVGGAVVDGASTAGSAVVSGAKATGSAVANGATAMKDAVMGTDKTVSYSCSVNGKKQAVSATYTFADSKAATATVKVAKKTLAKGLAVDASYTDGTQFTDGKNVWTLSETLTADNAATVVPVMFTVKGTNSDTVVAKNCALAK